MRRYRKARDLSQDALGKIVGRTSTSISQVERGINYPHRDAVERIDEALEADGEILQAFGYATANQSPDTRTLDEKMDWVVEQVTELVRQVSRMVTRWEIEDLPDGQSAGEHH